MPRKFSRRIVVDASIACAAGGEKAIDRTSVACTAFLEEIASICHQIVMTDDLFREWDEHASRHATEWFYDMFNKKGKVYKIEEHDLVPCEIAEPISAELEKDKHLIDAAINAEYRIASLDNEARDGFRGLAPTHKPVGLIVWVNPSSDSALKWLKEGAKKDETYRLGS